jgi:Ni/Co efflux regulator RcnB
MLAFLTWRPDMKPVAVKMNCALALVIGAVLAAGPVLAQPADKGNKASRAEQRDDQKGQRQEDRRDDRRGDQRGERRDQERASAAQRRHFEDQHRLAVRQYFGERYGEQYRGRRCPPGLAKKQNGCMPPGLAKKWQIGQRLPSNVIYYDVPQPLVMQIGPPPSGHRYVRVGGDILLLAVGTGMVLDAIQNLGR